LTARLIAVLLVALLLSSCATLGPDYEEPTVTLGSFKAIPSEGMIPAFEIGLRIINPNPQPLKLEGIVYTVSLEGYELIKGVGKDFPVIEGYSEGTVKLTAAANLLTGIRFITETMRSGAGPLKYEFKAKLDVGGFYPDIRVKETGEINLAERVGNEAPMAAQNSRKMGWP